MIIDKDTLILELITNKLLNKELAIKLNIPVHQVSYSIKKHNISDLVKQERTKNRTLIKKRFNLLEVIAHAGTDAWGKAEWECKCDCGRIVTISHSNLIGNHTGSCGCLRRILTGKRLWKGYGEIGMDVWSSIIRNSKSRNLEFNISIEYAWELFLKQNRRCALTNINLSLYKHRRNKIRATASLDRIDNTKGYIKGNVQWVHKHVNICKHTYTNEEFIEICNKVSKMHPR